MTHYTALKACRKTSIWDESSDLFWSPHKTLVSVKKPNTVEDKPSTPLRG